MIPSFKQNNKESTEHGLGLMKIKFQRYQSIKVSEFSSKNVSPKDPSASTNIQYSVAATLNGLLDGLLVLPVPPMVVKH